MAEFINIQIDIINIFILIIAITMLLSGVLVYLRGDKSETKNRYFLLSLPITAWAFSMVFFRSANVNNVASFWVQLLYFFPPLIPLTYVYLINGFYSQDQKWFLQPTKVITLILPVLVLVILCFVPGYLFENVAIRSGENLIEFHNFPYLLYTLIVAGYWTTAFTMMYKKFLSSRVQDTKQAMKFFLVGTFVSTIIAVVGNLLLPFFGTFYLNWIGQVGLIVMVTATFYSVINFNFLDIKIVASEVLTYSLIILLLARVFYSNSTEALAINLTSFIGSLVFGAFLIRSVYKEVQAREEAEQLTDELQHMNRQKSKMLSIASHQFRSPLTSIEGYASLIQKGSYGEVPEKLQKPINRIVTSSKKLARIVDDFLNISRVEDGRMKYNFKVTDIESVVREVVEEAESTATNKDLDLCFELDGSDTYPANVDIGKLQQVVTNLVDNAIKYTETGSVEVRLRRENEYILIEVEDTGIGIDPEDADIIFNQFSRADEAKDVNVVGSGLGLYIAKQIVEAHNGEIWATSPGKGEGSTFHVKLDAVDENNLDSGDEKDELEKEGE